MSVESISTMPLEAGQGLRKAKTEAFLHSRASTARPVSAVSVDTEFEYDSDAGDDGSAQSLDSGDSHRKSATTVSSYDEIPTPRSNRSSGSSRVHRPTDIQIKSIEGPRGPHLFRSSQLSAELDYALQMSPLLPKEAPKRTGTSFSEKTVTPTTRQRQEDYSIAAALAAPELNSDDAESQIRRWTSGQVVDWMLSCAVDPLVIECFEVNDVNGDVLLDLQFDHLKDQLGIQSFGKRHQLWSAICNLRGEQNVFSPLGTPFQDVSRPCTAPPKTSSKGTLQSPVNEDATPITPSGGKKRRGRKAPKGSEIVTPAESVSIVAIEQLMPKPHKCNKGERCAKWRKQQREVKQLQEENGIGRFPISPTKGGRIYITGDPGNATTAKNIVPNVRKQSEPTADHNNDTLPSVVASSDLLGPGQLPEFALHESMLGQLGNRDPQDNVRQFISLQNMHSTPESPPTPPPELAENTEPLPRATSVPVMFPSHHHSAYPSLIPPRNFRTPGPNENLRMLPKLEIPRSSSAVQRINTPASPETATTVCHSAIDAPSMLYRLGTPQSEMDVPVTALPICPVGRDTSQSVPPNMQYHQQAPCIRPCSTRPSVTDLRRPSTPLPALMEGEVLLSPLDDTKSTSKERKGSHSSIGSSQSSLRRSASTHDPVREKSAVKYFGYGEDCTHAGYMRKRKTKLLRHEWQDAHFRLVGSQLSMHENAKPASAVREKINIEDFGVSCSSNVSSSKLSAAMKAFRNKSNSADAAKSESTAFNFQLVPNKDGDRKAAASGKTHHFAVKTKDERIDWMREIMLSRARKQKGKGYDVEVNGEKF